MLNQEPQSQSEWVVLQEAARRVVVGELHVVVEAHQGVGADLAIVVHEEVAEVEGAAVALEVEGEVDEVQESARVSRVEGVGFEVEGSEITLFHVEFTWRSYEQYPSSVLLEIWRSSLF